MHATDIDPEIFYNEHLPPLVALALSNDVSRQTAEELAHEVLISSLRHLPTIRNIELWLASSLRIAIASRGAGA